MPLTKIPDSLLNKLQCAECNFYLSMAPVGVRSDGESVCKRCTDWIAPQSLAVASCKAFEELARLHLFPCSYRSQGCTEYVQFNQAFEHESKCAYYIYPCPACNWVGTINQICNHCKDQHPEAYLKTPNFRIDINHNHEIGYLVEVDGIMFLLATQVEDGKCRFAAIFVGYDTKKLSYIKYKVKLSGEESTRVMELEDKKPIPITRLEMLYTESIEVDVESLLVLLKYPSFIQCHWLITIPQEFQEQCKVETNRK